MKNLKIYQVFESYPLFYQPYIPPTLDLLAAQSGIDSTIIAFKGKAKGKEAQILPSFRNRVLKEFIYNRLHKRNDKFNFLEIKAIKNNVDIIHLQHSFLFNKVTSLLSLPNDKRPKIVITLRGGDTYVKPWLGDRWKLFYSEYGHKVDAFIVMSEDQKKYLHRWKVPLHRIHVIPISFGNKFEMKPKMPNHGTMKIISVFRMCWEKNIADNLRLIKYLNDLDIKVQYDIYGDGRDIGQLYYLIDLYDLNDCVNVKGRVDNKLIKEKLVNYDFKLQLSHSESLGMSVIEAQTYGVPAIVSNFGGLPEVVIDEKCGVIYDGENLEKLAKKIINLWEDKDKYYRFSQYSIKNSHEKYNVEMEVKLLDKLYQKLLK
jgi:glycosyltransferase involved in cell wall biosynthesis